MSSTILYKFRSGTTFEALPLPGSAARLFDVKKAIVTAKKLDTGSMEFDLSVRNATTDEEYADESMLLPRGTRLIVQRLPAAKGHGFLARMARHQYGIQPGAGANSAVGGAQAQGAAGGAPSGFYTIDSRARDEDDDEFVSNTADDEDKELAALKAVTETATAVTVGPRPTGGFGRGAPGPAGQGPPPRHLQHHGQIGGQDQQRPGRENHPQRVKHSADPELREQEKKALPTKKRATGIPRTFLNLSVAPTAETKDGEGEAESSTPLLQPNTLGFEELKSRGGGQSENATGTKKDLDYALKVTATTIPDYLQCGICHSVAKNAMFLNWDPEGRTACETCIRDALTQNGFRCPLTGMEGISPDDLHPNIAIRRAADAFVKGVMEKIEEIEKQQVEEAPEETEAETSKSGNILEGDSGEKGIIVTKQKSLSKRRSKDDDDPFGGDDDFGGDVFAVTANEDKAEEDGGVEGGDAPAPAEPLQEEEANDEVKSPRANEEETPSKIELDQKVENTGSDGGGRGRTSPINNNESAQVETTRDDESQKLKAASPVDRKEASPPSKSDSSRQQNDNRREREPARQRRGPPAGYQMGPAGGATGPHGGVRRSDSRTDRSDDNSSQGGRAGGRGRSSPTGRGVGRFQDRGGYRGRGRGGRGRFGSGRGRFDQQQGRGDWDSQHSSVRGGSRYDGSRSPSHDDVSTDSCMFECLAALVYFALYVTIWMVVALRKPVGSASLDSVVSYHCCVCLVGPCKQYGCHQYIISIVGLN
jgi:hypothetical protein